MKNDLGNQKTGTHVKKFTKVSENYYGKMATIDCGEDWSEFQDLSFIFWDSTRKANVTAAPMISEVKHQIHHAHDVLNHDHHSGVVAHMGTNLVYCTGCMRQQLSVWIPHLHMPHPDHHTTAYTAYAQFTAGALGGGTATYSTHWLDTVKVKMQTFPETHRSSIYCLQNILKEEGLTGLYQGATPAVVGHMAKTAVVFMSYGICEELVRKTTGCSKVEDLTIWHHAGSGAMTGVVASFVLCPMEIIKCRLQALQSAPVPRDELPARMSPLALVRSTLKSEGIRGLYRGLPGIWAKEIPGSFVYFGSYEGARAVMRHFNECPQLSTRAVFFSGMFAGLCFCVTHPIESVKTRVQVMSAVSETKGFFKAFVQILKTEGIKPLCSGLTPSLVRACLYSGIQFVTYETAREYFMRDN